MIGVNFDRPMKSGTTFHQVLEILVSNQLLMIAPFFNELVNRVALAA